MKIWSKKDEWMGYAGCLEDGRFISETSSEDAELEAICRDCKVRPECIEWAVSEKVSSVYVAGVRLPDPAYKRELRQLHGRLAASVPDEREQRGEI